MRVLVCGGGTGVRTCFGVGIASLGMAVMGRLTRELDLGSAPGTHWLAFVGGVGVERWKPLTTVMGRRVRVVGVSGLAVLWPLL